MIRSGRPHLGQGWYSVLINSPTFSALFANMKALMIPTRRKRKHRVNESYRRRSAFFQQLESRQLLASLAGEVWTDTNGNGFREPQESPAANVRVYLDANDDGQLNNGEAFTSTDTLGQYMFDNLAAGTHVVRLEGATGTIQTSPRGYFGVGNLPQSTDTQVFSMSESGQVQLIGQPTTTPIDGVVRTNAGGLFGVDATSNSLYTIDPITGVETLLVQHTADLVGGLAYDPVGDRLFAVARPNTSINVWTLQRVNQSDGSLTPLGSGLPGLSGISGLTFDVPQNRIVGFDNASDRFFTFDTGGQGSLLAQADRFLNATSLAKNDQTFVMFDNDDLAGTSVITVDPDSGITGVGFTATDSLTVGGLSFSDRGDFAHRVTVADTDDVTGLDFGVRSSVGQAINPLFGGFFLNELVVAPLGGNLATDQLIELRGAPGARLPQGTYLVVVNDDTVVNNGEVATVIDLSNQTFGQNGFLVLLPDGSPFVPDPDSNVLSSTGNQFSDLPGGIFQGVANSIGAPDQSSTYFLIGAANAPVVGGDIDGDNDGVVDGEAAQWEVHDSISLHPAVGRGSVAYGQIVFAERGGTDPIITVPMNSTLVPTGGFGYLARAGDSVGSDPEDWVAATIADPNPVDTLVTYDIVTGIDNAPSQPIFTGRNLDHFGDSNFFGGVRGTVIREAVAGDPNGLPQPAEGVLAYLDRNRNGRLDNLFFRLDPDSFPLPNTDLTNAFPGVTLTSVDEAVGVTSLQVQPAFENAISSNNRVFAQEPDPSVFQDGRRTNETKKLRVDFNRPVNFVSILGIGISNFTPSYVRLDAFDVDGNLIDTTLSGPLNSGDRQVIGIATTGDQIAYTEAYADLSVTDPFGIPISTTDAMVDQITYRQFEPNTLTDASGAYELENLVPGTFNVIFESQSPGTVLIGAQPVPLTITRYENYILDPNSVPVADEINEIINENTPIGTEIATVVAVDPDGGVLRFRIDDVNAPFSVDPITGVVSVSGPLDFESTPTLTVDITVIDTLGAQLSVPMNVELIDINEAPLVSNNPLSVAENTEVGTAIGQIPAIDPDFQQNQTLSFSVVGGTGQNAFDVSPSNGLVTVTDQAALDFETNPTLNLIVAVTDDGNPVRSTQIIQEIHLVDQNDAPQLVTTLLVVDENSTNIGTLTSFEPDANQRLRYMLDGGADAGLFTVATDGRVTTKPGVVLDFEQQVSYFIDVSVIDNGNPPLSDSGTVEVRLVAVNEPATIDQPQVSLAENSPGGTVVTQFTLTDPENEAGNYRMALAQKFDADKFVFDDTTNTLSVADGADLNFEDRVVQELEFQIIDDGPNPANAVQVVQVLLTDVNDPPSVTTTKLIVSENAAAGSNVGTVRVSDPDAGEVLTVSIVGGSASSLFDIDASTGALRVADDAVLDFETSSNLDLLIRVADDDGVAVESSVAIELNDVNEPPTINPNLTVPASQTGQPFEMMIPSDQVIDQDGSPFELTVLNLPSWLEFDPQSRTLSGLPRPADLGIYNLTLRAFEFGPLELFSELGFTLDVQKGTTEYTNGRNPLDVDANGEVAALDALLVINFIGRNGEDMSPEVAARFPGFVDVDASLVVSAGDALRVINALAVEQVEGELATAISSVGDDRDDSNDEALLSLLDESGGLF